MQPMYRRLCSPASGRGADFAISRLLPECGRLVLSYRGRAAALALSRRATAAFRRHAACAERVCAASFFLASTASIQRLTERYMAEGKLPNFSTPPKDRRFVFHRLRTTLAALSPVAWSTFATGVSPAKHNIFDFLNRSLKTYIPELAASKVRPAPRVCCGSAAWRLPLSSPRQSRCGARANRSGRFWANIPSAVRFCVCRLHSRRKTSMAACFPPCARPTCAERKAASPTSARGRRRLETESGRAAP